jgi:hypothetical protein
MVRKEKLVIALACLLLITSIIMSANATAGTHPNMVHPQAGGKIPNMIHPQASGTVINSTCSSFCFCVICTNLYSHDNRRLSLLLPHGRSFIRNNSLWQNML